MLKLATDVIEHKIPSVTLNFKYDKKAPALYRCDHDQTDLDLIAYKALEIERERLQAVWVKWHSWISAKGTRAPAMEKILVQLEISCNCGKRHRATFGAPTLLSHIPSNLVDHCLLIDISSASLEDRLNCLASKTEVMALLEKLLIRWHFISDRIIIASPFVGHQRLSTKEILDIWKWLFKNSDPRKVTVITKGDTWAELKAAYNESEMPYEKLERYGLQDNIITKGVAIQNFHAKFFAGCSSEKVELLSGSANLVRGPTLENISFSTMPAARFKKKYMDLLCSSLPQTDKAERVVEALVLTEKGWEYTILKTESWL
ncbi:phospholipase D-like domain-containing protein [Pseudomonas sp. LS2P72]